MPGAPSSAGRAIAPPRPAESRRAPFDSTAYGVQDQQAERTAEPEEVDAQARRPSPRQPIRRPAPRQPVGVPIVIVPGLPVGGVPALNPTVAISAYRFLPADLTVAIGTTVTWVNRDAVDHTVTSPLPGMVQTVGAFDGQVPPGGTFVFTFNAPGRFQYFCRLHPAMRGSVTVVDPQATAPEPGPPAAEPAVPATGDVPSSAGSASGATRSVGPAAGSGQEPVGY